MSILKFNTGRGYSPQGQRISATLLPDGRMVFVDHDRGIRGRTLQLCPVLNEAQQQYWLMKQYDLNQYEDLLRSETPEALLEL